GWFMAGAWFRYFRAVPAAQPNAPSKYDRDVRPILPNNCFKCHGPDAKERQAGLRLDARDEALKPTESGRKAIVPGNADASMLVRRILSPKPDFIMPLPESKKTLRADVTIHLQD